MVLDGRRPPISNSERDLTRKERSTLAQLRSGYSRLLGSYTRAESRRMQASTSVPTVARRHMMSSISSFSQLTRLQWYRQTYGADRRTLSGNSTISRRETRIEMNMDWKANNNNTHHLYNCIHIRTILSPLDLWTDPAGVTALLARWTEKLAGGPQAGRSDSPH